MIVGPLPCVYGYEACALTTLTRVLSMGTWALAEAKAKLSEVVEKAVHHEPQQITKNGKPVAMIVSMDQWRARHERVGNQRSTAEFSGSRRCAEVGWRCGVRVRR